MQQHMDREHVQVEPDSDRMVRSALDMLGKSSVEALLYHLRSEYGVRIESGVPIDMKKLELALADMLGVKCSELIMSYIAAEIMRE